MIALRALNALSPRLRRAGGFLALLALGGCSSLRTTTDPKQVTHNDHPVKAVTAYYLPKGMIQISGAPDAQNRFVVTLSEVLQPETERTPFYLRYAPGIFVNDYVRAQVNPSGLLESVVFMDSNPNWNAVGQGALPTVTLAFANAGKPAPFTRRVDPFDPPSVAACNRALAGVCRLHFRLPPPVQVSTRTKDKGRIYDGVVFHPALPVTVAATCSGDTQEAVFPMPDRRVTLAFSLDRGLLDQRGTEVEFMDGMLTQMHITNQSIITVLLGIPKGIITDVLPLPPGW